jgi:hypothetical protein
VGQADPPQGTEQRITHRGEPQAQLIGPHGGGRGAVGIESKLTFLDAVQQAEAKVKAPGNVPAIGDK